MAIIGRKEEIRELEKCERSKKSELICVYGRRRVGKTYLVEQTYADYFAFRATGVESGNTRTQQNHLSRGLRKPETKKNVFRQTGLRHFRDLRRFYLRREQNVLFMERK